MTATELASFRALLQAQASAQPGPDRGLFARMRARLTVVEGGAGLAAPSPDVSLRTASRPPVAARVEEDDLLAPGPVADPPPSQPPAFGRRDAVDERPASKAAHPKPAPDPAAVLELTQAVRLLHCPAAPAGPCTPDDLDDPRVEVVATRSQGPAPGIIAGWSRTRPPGAQRRLLGRLEAVLLAEREGLEARRAADAPAG